MAAEEAPEAGCARICGSVLYYENHSHYENHSPAPQLTRYHLRHQSRGDEVSGPLPQSLFSLGPDEASNAYLSWGLDAWESYISGYRDAARSLVRDLESLVPEWAFYPIAFLYRHCLELQLKSLIVNTNQFLGLSAAQPHGHDLKQLWTDARTLLTQIGFNATDPSFARADQTIQELTAADPSGQSFRYAMDTKGLPTLGGVGEVNVRAFGARMDELVDFLLGQNEALHVEIQAREEADDEALWLSGY